MCVIAVLLFTPPKKPLCKVLKIIFLILWIIQPRRERHVDNVPCCFFSDTYPQQISPHRNRNPMGAQCPEHFPSMESHAFPLQNGTYPRSKCRCCYSGRFAFFGLLCYTLMEREGHEMDNDRNRDPGAIYEDLVSALEAQVKKQEEIIQIQDETIRALRKHNEELAAFLDHCHERH